MFDFLQPGPKTGFGRMLKSAVKDYATSGLAEMFTGAQEASGAKTKGVGATATDLSGAKIGAFAQFDPANPWKSAGDVMGKMMTDMWGQSPYGKIAGFVDERKVAGEQGSSGPGIMKLLRQIATKGKKYESDPSKWED